jgi:NADPH-ferrihemoprotein reductase
MYLRGVLSAGNRVTLTRRVLSSTLRWSSRSVTTATATATVFPSVVAQQPNSSMPPSPSTRTRHFFQRCPEYNNMNGSVHPLRRHFLASASKNNLRELPVKILWGSQGGTARIFAMQLSEALEAVAPDIEVTIQGLHEDSPTSLLQPGRNLHVLLASTSGVGQPPDNARDFYDWLTTQADQADTAKLLQGVDFCVFGLGNQKAHPNHFNVIGKGLDEKLSKLGANRILELGLGDDGDCIEDDYDSWMEAFLKSVYQGDNNGDDIDTDVQDEATPATHDASTSAASTATVDDPTITLEPCVGAKVGSGGKRLISSKYGRLRLTPSGTDVSRDDLLQLESPFYLEHTKALPVLSNRPLNPNAGENGLFEMRVSLQNSSLQYETGDHLMVYPQNSQAIIEGFLQQFDVDPHVLIEAPTEPGEGDSKKRPQPYPHPTGITLTETLRHCVDFNSPSPSFARLLTGRTMIDFKNDIAVP